MLPINSSYPFWSYTTGSKLKLTTLDNLRCLIVTVHSISRPYVYKLEFNSEITYHNKKQIIKIIKNEWWKYYGSKTLVEMEKHNNVDMSSLIYKLSDGNSGSSLDSCPSSPSPESLRKTSLRITLSKKNFPINHSSPRNYSSESSNSPRSSSSSDSSQNITPRSRNSPSPDILKPDSLKPDSPKSVSPKNNEDSKTLTLLKRVSDKLLGK